MIKTNAIRLLDKAKIEYKTIEYDVSNNESIKSQVLANLDIIPDKLFKTLVTRGDKTGITIFCIPINKELDLKKAAKVSNNKKVEMILAKTLLSTVGYIHGACSPIGMKKLFPTYIEQQALDFDEIGVSGGAKGLELIINPKVLSNYTNAIFASLT